MLIATFLTGLGVALWLSLPPGPVTVETMRRGLHGGFRPALMVQCGSLIGDVAWCAAAMVGLAPLVAVPWVRLALGFGGSALLVWLGASEVRHALRPARQRVRQSAVNPVTRPGEPKPAGAGEAFRAGVAISLANPMAVGYWVSLGAALLASDVVGPQAIDSAAFLAGYVAGVSAWALVVAIGVGRLHVSLAQGSRPWRGLHLACGAALITLGSLLAWRVAGPLLALQ
jgi:chemosensory pili system protein ChpE